MGKLTINGLTGGFHELAEIIGMDNAELLARRMGGLEVYIPKIDTVERLRRNQRIAAEFDGSNHARLALKYNLTERQIRAIIECHRKSSPSLSIEDFLPEEEN